MRTTGKQCGLAATGVYQPSLRSPWLAAKATNPDGKWSPEPTALTLNILPHWYQTWWAWLLLGLLAASLVYAYVRLRMGNILRQNLELEKRVNARTKALTEANQQLAKLARTDTLTDMLNRRAFAELYQHNLTNPANCTQCALALLDIDLFKNFNDSYGHDCGDAVLREMSRLLRENDVVARWGGWRRVHRPAAQHDSPGRSRHHDPPLQCRCPAQFRLGRRDTAHHHYRRAGSVRLQSVAGKMSQTCG